MGIRHAHQSAKIDTADPLIVGKVKWNDDHSLVLSAYNLSGQDGATVAAAINNELGTVTPTVSEQRISDIRVTGTLAGTVSETALNGFSWDLQQNATGVNSRVRGALGEVRLNSSAGIRGLQSVVRAIGAASTGDMTAIIGQAQIDAGGNPSQANCFQASLVSELANFGTGIKIAIGGGSGGSYAHGILMDEGGTTYGTAAIRLPIGPTGGKIMWGNSGAFLRNTSSNHLELAARLGINIDPEAAFHVAFDDDTASEHIRFSNVSDTAGTNKHIGVLAKGRTTVGVDVDVGRQRWVPIDANWNDATLQFFVRRNSTLEETATFTSQMSDTETALVVRRNVGGTFSMQRVFVGVVDSGGSGFRLLRVAN